MPESRRYENYIRDWRSYRKGLERTVRESPERMKEVDLALLQRFYVELYDQSRDFYEQFYRRMG